MKKNFFVRMLAFGSLLLPAAVHAYVYVPPAPNPYAPAAPTHYTLQTAYYGSGVQPAYQQVHLQQAYRGGGMQRAYRGRGIQSAYRSAHLQRAQQRGTVQRANQRGWIQFSRFYGTVQPAYGTTYRPYGYYW